MSAQKVSKSRVTTVTAKKAGDTAALVTNGSDAFPEDSYSGSYMTAGSTGATAILEPNFKPGVLRFLCQQNNILYQCIDAMEVNVDGTGHKIALIEGAKENEKEKLRLESFFANPYPERSMVTIRRELRRDLEITGNAYMEVIRNVEGEVLMCNNLDAETTRLIRMDAAVIADKIIHRDGADMKVKVRTRERRFVQLINGKKTYFKEFGSSRTLDRTTGEWVAENSTKKLPIDKQASEVIHLTIVKEAKSPYGVPRWINQLPSVLGSRKAEEHNLEFFDAGGLPPVLVLVQGGYLGEEVKDELRQHLAGQGASKHRAAIVEAISSSGSLDSAGSVQVRVERFGSERQSDSMFREYDKNCEEHIRVSFRLPPMFIGRSQDYNFATALTGCMIAEAQIFYPERYEFDEIINNTIVKALGVLSYRFQSLPVTLSDMASQLKAVELSLGKVASGESIIKTLNEVTGLNLEYKEPEPAPDPNAKDPNAPKPLIDPKTNLPYNQPQTPPKTPEEIAAEEARAEKARQQQLEDRDATHAHELALAAAKKKEDAARLAKKSERTSELILLANGWAGVLGLTTDPLPEGVDAQMVTKQIGELSSEDAHEFNQIMAAKALTMSSVDLPGLAELCGCGGTLMGA